MENRVDITSKCNFSKGKNHISWILSVVLNNKNIHNIEGMEFVLDDEFTLIVEKCNVKDKMEGDWDNGKIYLTFDTIADAASFKLKYL